MLDPSKKSGKSVEEQMADIAPSVEKMPLDVIKLLKGDQSSGMVREIDLER